MAATGLLLAVGIYLGKGGISPDLGSEVGVEIGLILGVITALAQTIVLGMGLASRRRYRWTRGRVSDYWDEVFTEGGLDGQAAALDDQSAFIASLGSSRSPRMRDVLGTIQADQDAIIRAGSRGALVVDGGPGTGKTVVALHRSAYLLYSDPRLGHHRGGVLFGKRRALSPAVVRRECIPNTIGLARAGAILA